MTLTIKHIPGRQAHPIAGLPVRLRIFAALSVGLFAIGYVLSAPAESTASSTPEAEVAGANSGVDVTIAPGDDFFAYANGGWLKATALPAGKARWTAAAEIGEQTRAQVLKLLDEAAAAPPGSIARKVADFRIAWLDEAAIEAKGISAIKPLLDRIDHVHNRAGLTRLLGSGLAADVDPMNLGLYRYAHVLGLATQASIHGEKNYVAFLIQGGLGLPDRENYLSTAPAMQAKRARYRDAVMRVLEKIDGRPSTITNTVIARADAVLALETALAQSHATQEFSGNERNADRLWTRADFAREAPGMDWLVFFAAARMPNQPAFVAWQPSAVKGLAALVASQALPVWKDYLRVRVVADHADLLPRVFARESAALHGRNDNAPNQSQTNPRLPRATEATLSAMSEAIGRLYHERYFPTAYKARVQTITGNVLAAFTRRVETAEWMTPESKRMALAKLKSIYFGVGNPEAWRSFADLTIAPDDAAGNTRRIAERNYRLTLARLGKPIDRREWAAAPQWAGGLLLFQQNSYNFTAALLQAPKFDPAASDAMNYGAIGAIAGHEMSHFIDTLGAEYEADGRARRWWTAQEVSRFEALSRPLVEQFSAYRPFPNLALDGKLGLTENIADLGGLAAAFDAHRAALGSRAADADYVRQQDRQFFIGFARGWRSRYHEEGLRKQAATDHAPENFRVATVRNIDAWYEAFDVRPGQRLYLAPALRVRIW